VTPVLSDNLRNDFGGLLYSLGGSLQFEEEAIRLRIFMGFATVLIDGPNEETVAQLNAF
jgi:hypothetical protein